MDRPEVGHLIALTSRPTKMRGLQRSILVESFVGGVIET
jgi:hypothetical protein